MISTGKMFSRVLNLILTLSQEERSLPFRIVSILIGVTVFLLIIPWILITLAAIVSKPVGINWPRLLELSIASASITVGLFFLIWSVVCLWLIGKGTPAPVSPTQNLVIVGPYRLCRNPIHLGAVLYYLGVGTLLESFTVGLLCFVLALVGGSLYHKFVEEKELLMRFGEEYKKYKEKTPFLIPRFPWR